MSYTIISGQSLWQLADNVRRVEQDGAKIHGAPFFDAAANTWNQAVDVPPKSKEVRLREPADKKSS